MDDGSVPDSSGNWRSSAADPRWSGLFADLEAQLAAVDRADLAAEVESRARTETSRLRLIDRLRPAIHTEIRLALQGAPDAQGVLRRVGREWLLLDGGASAGSVGAGSLGTGSPLDTGSVGAGSPHAAEPYGGEAIVSVAAVLAVRGVGRWSAVPETEGLVESRLGLAHALRGVARDREPVRIWLTAGQQLEGTIDRVGSDFFEVATHDRGEFRRAGQVRDVYLVAFTGLAVVRRSVTGLR